MEKIILTTDDVFSNLDISHIISDEENIILFDYFKNQEEEEIENVNGKTIVEAANIIGPKDFEEETLQHILITLFPDKYEASY